MTSKCYLVFFYFAIASFGQTYTVQTIAGSGTVGLLGGGFSGDGGSATSAMLSQPMGVAWDGSNNTLIVADTGNGRLRRLLVDGTITSLNVRITRPQAPAVDSSGNVYIDESSVTAIVRIAPSGQAATIAGDGYPTGLRLGLLDTSRVSSQSRAGF
jgi:sugar lactone lactonase YvrE